MFGSGMRRLGSVVSEQSDEPELCSGYIDCCGMLDRGLSGGGCAESAVRGRQFAVGYVCFFRTRPVPFQVVAVAVATTLDERVQDFGSYRHALAPLHTSSTIFRFGNSF